VIPNQTEAAYARSDLFEKRALMDNWSTTSPPDGAAIAWTRSPPGGRGGEVVDAKQAVCHARR